MHVTRGQLGTTGAPEIPGSSVQPRIHLRSFLFLFFFELTAPYQNAGPTRGIRHAFGRDCDLSLLHCVDPVNALRRPRPPSPRHLPTPCLGHPHPRHPHTLGFCRSRHLHRNCHDQQQQEEGSQGQSCG